MKRNYLSGSEKRKLNAKRLKDAQKGQQSLLNVGFLNFSLPSTSQVSEDLSVEVTTNTNNDND